MPTIDPPGSPHMTYRPRSTKTSFPRVKGKSGPSASSNTTGVSMAVLYKDGGSPHWTVGSLTGGVLDWAGATSLGADDPDGYLTTLGSPYYSARGAFVVPQWVRTTELYVAWFAGQFNFGTAPSAEAKVGLSLNIVTTTYPTGPTVRNDIMVPTTAGASDYYSVAVTVGPVKLAPSQKIDSASGWASYVSPNFYNDTDQSAEFYFIGGGIYRLPSNVKTS